MMKLHLHRKNMSRIAIGIFISAIAYLVPVSAQEAEPGSEVRESGRLRLTVPPPSEGEKPTGTDSGAGTRPLDQSKCPTVDRRITALVPVIRGVVGGSTLAGHPTFWFYVPYAGSEIDKISFVVQNERYENLHLPVELKPAKTPGAIGIQLPSASMPLEVGKEYRWYFTVYCDPEEPTDFDSVEGVVRRLEVSSALASQLESATPSDRIALYAENSIWYDALTLLGEILRADPNNPQLIQDWKDLLTLRTQEGDSSNIEAKIADCCNFDDNSNPANTDK